MEATYCACVIANLEGVKRFPLPNDSFLAPELAILDTRAQKLERAAGLLRPPPSADPTWNSLVGRVARIAIRTRCMSRSAPLSVPEPPLDASMGLLLNIIASMNNTNPDFIVLDRDVVIKGREKDTDDEKTVCDDKDAGDERLLNVIRQQLCHAIGRRCMKIERVPYDLASTCSLAMNLALEIEAPDYVSLPPGVIRPAPAGMRPPPAWTGIPRPPPPPGIINVHKIRRRKARKLSRASRKKSWWNGGRVGGLLGKLVWWRTTKKVDEESDSDSETSSAGSSSVSGTSIVDY